MSNCQDVVLMLCTTQPGAERGLDIGFSSFTALNYLVLVSKYFRCILETLRISGNIRSGLGVQK